MSDAITIRPLVPPAPYTLADTAFITTLEHCEKQIAELKIVDAASNQLAGVLQNRLTAAGKKLEEAREEINRPALDWQRLVNTTAKRVSTRIDAAKSALSTALVAYNKRQLELAAAAEKKRQDDIARLEREAQVERDAAAKKAREMEEAAAKIEADRQAKLTAQQKADAEELSFLEDEPEAPALPPEKTETELKLEAIKFAPAAVVAAPPPAIKFVTELRIESVDVFKLPEVFIRREALEGKIKAAYCVGWTPSAPMPEVSGVVFRIHSYASSTGKAQF